MLKKDVPGRGVLGYLCCCCVRPPRAVVTVFLDTAQNLHKQDLVGAGKVSSHVNTTCTTLHVVLVPGADPYCIVKCGRSKAVTPVKKNTLAPSFNARVQFFVNNPATTEVTVEVSG